MATAASGGTDERRRPLPAVPPPLSRRRWRARRVVHAGAARLPRGGRAEQGERNAADKLPGGLEKDPLLDSWIRIDADGTITVFTGKAELGQGIKTALIQIAAEELYVDPARVRLVTADTARTPNEGYTAGSHSMQDSGTAILNAAAQVRGILVDLAAARFGVLAQDLALDNGVIRAKDARTVGYGDLVRGEVLHVRAQPQSPLKDPRAHTVIGKSLPRVDIPGKVTGTASYVQDLRPARHGACPRRAAAGVRRAPRGRRQRGRVAHARRAEGRARRQLSRGDRGARVAGDHRDARARRCRPVGAPAQAATAARRDDFIQRLPARTP